MGKSKLSCLFKIQSSQMLGIKQEGLTYDLGEDWCHKKIIAIRTKRRDRATYFGAGYQGTESAPWAIKTFDQEVALNIFSNAYHDDSSILETWNFNPIDNLLEALDEDKKL